MIMRWRVSWRGQSVDSARFGNFIDEITWRVESSVASSIDPSRIKKCIKFYCRNCSNFLTIKIYSETSKMTRNIPKLSDEVVRLFFRWKIIINSGRRSSRQRCDQRTVKLQHLFDSSAVAWKETQTPNAARLLNPHFENLLDSSWINWNYAIAMAHANRRWPIFVPHQTCHRQQSALETRNERNLSLSYFAQWLRR